MSEHWNNKHMVVKGKSMTTQMLRAEFFNIHDSIMDKVDFAENEVYLTICGKVRNNVYDGEKENAHDAGTSRA